MRLPPGPSSPFPIPYAFVVQLAAETPLEGARLRGRVEHVVSHQAATFDSLEALGAFMLRVLGHAQEEAAEAEPAPRREEAGRQRQHQDTRTNPRRGGV